MNKKKTYTIEEFIQKAINVSCLVEIERLMKILEAEKTLYSPSDWGFIDYLLQVQHDHNCQNLSLDYEPKPYEFATIEHEETPSGYTLSTDRPFTRDEILYPLRFLDQTPNTYEEDNKIIDKCLDSLIRHMKKNNTWI